MSNVANLDKYSKDIFDDIGKAIETFPLKEMENDLQYTSAITGLTNTIFTTFRTVFDSKKNPGKYRNCFDERIRDKQNEYFHHPEFRGVYNEVRDFDEEGPVDRTYFDSICNYCELNGLDVQTIIRYFIVVKSLIAVLPIIGDYKRKPNIFQDDNSSILNENKHTMTNEQKNQILKYLIDNENRGTLDGKVIGPLFGVRPDHVIMFVEKLDRSFGYIDYIGMAQHYFQIRTTPDGIEFYENGGFKSESSITASHTANLASASIGGNVTIIMGNNNSQHITTHIKAGDINLLRETLKRHNVPEEDIKELENIIDNDNPDVENKKVGAKVGSWLKKMLGKTIDATWKVGTDVAAKVLTEAINQHYGIK